MKYRISAILTLFLFLSSLGCGSQHTIETPSNPGITITVKNEMRSVSNERAVYAALTLHFCAPIKFDPRTKEIIPIENRCVQFDNEIHHNESKQFHISPAQVSEIYAKGNGYASIEFSDDKQILSGSSWRCFWPSTQKIDPYFSTKGQTFHVSVVERGILTYGCLIRGQLNL